MNTYLYLIPLAEIRWRNAQAKKLTLLAKFPFDSRSQAPALGKAPRSKYAEYRLEGEWFRPKVLGMICEGLGLRYKNHPYGPNQARKTLKEMTLSTHQI
jgi:hypothetical protein